MTLQNVKICVQSNVVLLDSLVVVELNKMGTVKTPYLSDLEKEKSVEVVVTSGLPRALNNVFVRLGVDLQDEGGNF
jgi:hypothetical protein